MIFPVPQKIKCDGERLCVTAFSASGDEACFVTEYLKNNSLNAAENGFPLEVKILSGESNCFADKASGNTDEKYSVNITTEKITIEAFSKRGVFYALNLLSKLVSANELCVGEIEDYPLFKMRGYIEGFYGKEWTYEARSSFMTLMAKNNMNTYFYAPKDDAFHRERWRELYPEKELSELKSLYRLSAENQMDFFWCIGPGLTYHYSSEDDYCILIEKIKSIYEIGVKNIGLLLDDIPWDFRYDDDKAYFDDIASAHIALVNSLYRDLKAFDSNIKLVVCPTQYSGEGNENYISKFGSAIPSDVLMFWTGEEICSRVLRVREAEVLKEATGHMPLYWDNFPVNDCEMFNEMHLDGIRGRESGLYKYSEGLISNVMEYAECSKIPLLTIADYLWNPLSYDREKSLYNAQRVVLGDKAESFFYFADHMGVSCLSKYSSSFMSEKLSHIQFLYQNGEVGKAVSEFSEYNKKMRECFNMLNSADIPLFKELAKWTKKFGMCCDLLDLILKTQLMPSDDNKAALKEMLNRYNYDAVLLTGFCLREAAEKTLLMS